MLDACIFYKSTIWSKNYYFSYNSVSFENFSFAILLTNINSIKDSKTVYLTVGRYLKCKIQLTKLIFFFKWARKKCSIKIEINWMKNGQMSWIVMDLTTDFTWKWIYRRPLGAFPHKSIFFIQFAALFLIRYRSLTLNFQGPLYRVQTDTFIA